MLDAIAQFEFEWWAQSNPLQAVAAVVVVVILLRSTMRCLSATMPAIVRRAGQWSGMHNSAYQKVVPKTVEGCCYKYGVVTLQGRRDYQEDRCLVLPQVGGEKKLSLYAVFDGHGGSTASQFCIDNFADIIAQVPGEGPSKNPGEALDFTFKNIDQKFLQLAHENHLDSGTTAIAMLASDKKFTVANTGDSRAVLVKLDGSVKALSEDHKPQRTDERERVNDLGGLVVHWGVWRIEGILAVSRAIGDRMLKKYVIPDPEVTTTIRKPDDAFIVIATDGLWDVMTNDEVGLFLEGCNDPQIAADILVSEAFGRGSLDNITVAVVDISEQPQEDVISDGTSSKKAR